METPANLQTCPGKPLVLNAEEWSLYDSDGIASVKYQVTGEDYASEYTQLSGADGYTLELYHSDETAQYTNYALECVLTDNYGQSRTYDTEIEVVNTQAGTLYTDEYWSDDHSLTGEVIVPDGVTLTIADGTTVSARGSYGSSLYEPGGLTVDTGGTMQSGDNVIFERSDTFSSYWTGITLKGTGVFTNLSIREALRGLTVYSGSEPGEISGCDFAGNRIGLHVFKDGLVVDGSTFTDNLYYGIKEDGGASPVVTECDFFGNGYDYYDSNLTVLDIEELNGLDGNSGNTGEEN